MTPPAAATPPAPDRGGQPNGTWGRFGEGPTLLVVLIVLFVVRLVAIIAVIRSGAADAGTVLGGDPERYLEILRSSGVPYRDFPVEFPPLTLALLSVLPRSTLSGAVVGVALSQLVLEAGTALALAWAWGKRTALVYLLLGTPIALLFAFPYFRIDLLSVFLAVAGLGLLRKRHQLTGASVLAVAVFAKVWPLALGPVLVVRRQWRGFGVWVATGAVGTAAWMIWAGTEGVRQVTTYRGANGWQIESIPGSWFHFLDPAASTIEQGAMRTAVQATGGARLALTAASVVVVGLAWWLASRVHPDRLALATESYAPLLATSALIVFSPIISPQYVLWLLPFAAIAAARGDYWVGGLVVTTGALSSIQLQINEAVIEGRWWAMSSLTLRNALLIAVGSLCSARLVRLRRQPDDLRRPRPSPLAAGTG